MSTVLTLQMWNDIIDRVNTATAKCSGGGGTIPYAVAPHVFKRSDVEAVREALGACSKKPTFTPLDDPQVWLQKLLDEITQAASDCGCGSVPF